MRCEERRSIPGMRFRGFTTDWEQWQTGTIADVVKKINEANFLNHEGDVLRKALEGLQ